MKSSPQQDLQTTVRSDLVNRLSPSRNQSISQTLKLAEIGHHYSGFRKGLLESISIVTHAHKYRGTFESGDAREYNWATLFLGKINSGTWPTRLGESKK
jgi:hypothetical protein